MNKNFGSVLKDIRKGLRVTQEELAKKIDRDASYISRLERGLKIYLDRKAVYNLAKALNLDNTDTNKFLLAAGYASGANSFNHTIKSTTLSHIKEALEQLMQRLIGIEDFLMGRYQNPEILTYWELLNQLGYLDWEDPQKQNKERIANWIAKNILKKGATIFLDAGTTAMQVAYKIVEHGLSLSRIYTNNLIAAIRLMTANHSCTLIGGELRILSDWEPYSIEISGAESQKMVKDISTTITILGATSISFKNGPCATREQSLAFKRTLIRNANKLVIVADYTKFARGIRGDKPILAEREWTQIRDTITTVATSAPKDKRLYGNIFSDEIKLFRNKLHIV